MKSLEELASLYQQILRRKFPDIIVKLDPDVADSFVGGMFAIFSVPDSRENEYSQYIYGEFPATLKEEQVEFVNIILHIDSDTRKYYPSIWQEVCTERASHLIRSFIQDVIQHQSANVIKDIREIITSVGTNKIKIEVKNFAIAKMVEELRNLIAHAGQSISVEKQCTGKWVKTPHQQPLIIDYQYDTEFLEESVLAA